MLCTKDTVKAAGLNIWANGSGNNGPEVDIIAVQGLGAHPYYTWVKKPDLAQQKKSSNLLLSKAFHKRISPSQELSDAAQTTSDRSEVMWLRDLLPNLIPNARIASYSYKSDWRQDVKTNLRKCGEQFLNVLHQNRASDMERQRPLIIIGHSLGGLVIKQVLVLANHGEIFKNIKMAIVGILFLGTPHQGSSAAEYGVWLARALGNDTTLLETLTKNCPTLFEVARDFEASYSNTDVICFCEERDGPMGIQFVDHQSASLSGKRRMYLNTDHSGLNKYVSPQDENFLLVQAEICRMAQAVPQTIKDRYQSYKMVQKLETFHLEFSLGGIPMIKKFVGRETEITRLAQLMIPPPTDDMHRKVCVLHGMGGVGKSQLAVEFALRYKKEFSAIFWIAASTKEKLRRSIAAVAQSLPQHQIPERARSLSNSSNKVLDEVIRGVLKWFSQPLNDKWLLIFDNVDREFSALSEDPEAFDVKEYLPEADQGSILITSRLAGMWRLAENDMRLDPFDELQGEFLLSHIVGESYAGSLELVNLLQGLPLAIDQAASYMHETGTTALEYIASYDKTWRELMAEQQNFALQEATAPSVLTTWTVSFNDLQKKCQEAANLLILWAFLDNQDIWYELFTPVLDSEMTENLPAWFSRCIGDKFVFKKCIRFLTRYSFLTINTKSSSFSVHSVLHRWCLHSFDQKKKDIAWLAIMIVASAVPVKSNMESILLQRRLLPHCNRVYSLLHQHVPENMTETLGMSLINACDFLGGLYLDQGRVAEAEAMCLRALAGKKKAWEPDDKSTLATVNNLGILYSAQSRMAEAEAMFKWALAGAEKIWGQYDEVTLKTANNLGLMYSDQGMMAKAEAMHLRALTGFEKTRGEDHTSTLGPVQGLGALYTKQGNLAEAEAMNLRALAGCEKAWGSDHIFTLNAMNNLGLLYLTQDKIADSEAMFRRAIAGKEKALGPDDRSTLETVGGLGILYLKHGKTAEAKAMFLRALTGIEEALGPDHISTLRIVANLGDLYLHQDNMAEAEAMYLRALAGFEKAGGLDHTSTLNHLGDLYTKQGKITEAEAMFLRALAGFEKAWGPDHESALNTLNNLGNLYVRQGKMAEAEAMFLRALAGFEKARRPEEKSTLTTVNNLGILYASQGKMAEAEAMFLRALAGFEKAQGPEKKSTLTTVNNLGILYASQGKMAEAEAKFLRALTGNEKACGPDDKSTLETVDNLGLLYSGQGKMAEAEAMYLRALAIYEKVWGPNHKDTLDKRYHLANMFGKSFMFQEAAMHFELVLQGYTKLLGPEHPETVNVSKRLEYCKRVAGDVDENDGDDNGGDDGGGGSDCDGDGGRDVRGGNYGVERVMMTTDGDNGDG